MQALGTIDWNGSVQMRWGEMRQRSPLEKLIEKWFGQGRLGTIDGGDGQHLLLEGAPQGTFSETCDALYHGVYGPSYASCASDRARVQECWPWADWNAWAKLVESQQRGKSRLRQQFSCELS